jgi:hypothetical protein
MLRRKAPFWLRVPSWSAMIFRGCALPILVESPLLQILCDASTLLGWGSLSNLPYRLIALPGLPHLLWASLVCLLRAQVCTIQKGVCTLVRRVRILLANLVIPICAFVSFVVSCVVWSNNCNMATKEFVPRPYHAKNQS